MHTWHFSRALATLAVISFLSACGGGSSSTSIPPVATPDQHQHASPTPTQTPTPNPALNPSSNLTANMTAQGQWLAQHQLADGAIVYTSTEIEPYYANLAAVGLVKIPSQLANVRAWIGWYVAHINTTDVWNLGNTIYDYTYTSSGVETATKSADSVDSYVATFFTLLRQLYDTGDPTSQAYVVSLRPTLEKLGATIIAIQQPDGMTIAMPSYPIAYLEDNCEVHRGLSDLAYLEQTAFSNSTNAAKYTAAAAQVAGGISTLWSSSLQAYAWAKGEPGGELNLPSWSTWYPDATSQLFPVLDGVIPATSSRAVALWKSFNTAFPTWDQLTDLGSSAGGFPTVLVGDAAAMMGDVTHSSVYIQSIQKIYGASGYPWPWYDAEAGWYIRMDNQLNLGSSLAPTEN
ncbi:MAG TPA: hypothetical protein VGZ00_03070 [Candidatus Baltobacteraceae bacterium]|jgi:hypothetical protein|nr:hypothetical protein [Candidatus Baltobacteraceae bacterium]